MLIPLRDFRPSSTTPVVTLLFMGINFAIFIIQYYFLGSDPSGYFWNINGSIQELTSADAFTFQFGVTACELFGQCAPFPPSEIPAIFTLFTSMFLHGDLMHILGNMWFLWIFGDNIEDALGKAKFILFYVIGGVIAALAQLIIDPGGSGVLIGASGAIAAVMGAYIVLYPHGRIQTLLFIFIVFRSLKLPALFVLGYWFLLQVLFSYLGGEGVAYMAHIGGFIAGALLIRIFVKTPERTENYLS